MSDCSVSLDASAPLPDRVLRSREKIGMSADLADESVCPTVTRVAQALSPANSIYFRGLTIYT